jgi:hypothetical protein
VTFISESFDRKGDISDEDANRLYEGASARTISMEETTVHVRPGIPQEEGYKTPVTIP